MSTHAMHDDDIVALDAVRLSQHIHAFEVSCVDVLQAYLVQIDQHNPQVNAIVAQRDRDALLAQARALDAELAQGRDRGPLHGFPQAPKDIAPVAGMVTTRGSPIFREQVTTVDAIVFERMRQAGCIFVGRTNSPEFGLGGHTYNPVYGATKNAFDPRLSAGGSSGGAAVALALRMLPVADGSDMMGSLRTPAAFNNVFGFRPSFGLVPDGPAGEVFFQQFAVAGPMARNVPDLTLLLQVQAGFDARAPLTHRSEPAGSFAVNLDRAPEGARIGWLGDLGGHLTLEPGLLDVYCAALTHFDTIGCRVESIVPPFDLDALWHAWIDLRSFMFAGANVVLYHDAEKRQQLKPEARWEIERGLQLSGTRIYDAACVRSAWYQTLCALFERFDFLVLPATQVFPFPIEWPWPKRIAEREMDTYHRWMETVIYATLSGCPTISVPAGFNAQGVPCGLQLIGPAQADAAVLRLAHAYDQASGYARVGSGLL